MARHKYIQKLFTIIEFVIIFLIIAFLVATHHLGSPARSQTLSDHPDCDIGTIIKSPRNCMSERLNLSEIGSACRFTVVTP
jgi:hypothetical protein